MTRVDGKLWPCVVFQDSKIPLGLLSSKTSRFSIPVFVLGRRMFHWRMESDLEEYVPSQDYLEGYSVSTDSDRSGSGKDDQRRCAFDEAAQFRSMEYYQDVVTAKMAGEEEARNRQNHVDMGIDVVPISPSQRPSVKRKARDNHGFGTSCSDNRNHNNSTKPVVDLCSSDEEDEKTKTNFIMTGKQNSERNGKQKSKQNNKHIGNQITTNDVIDKEDNAGKPNGFKKGKEKAKSTLSHVIPNLPVVGTRVLSKPAMILKEPVFRQAGFRFESHDAEGDIQPDSCAINPGSQTNVDRITGLAGIAQGTRSEVVKGEIDVEEQTDRQAYVTTQHFWCGH